MARFAAKPEYFISGARTLDVSLGWRAALLSGQADFAMGGLVLLDK
jgi:hypothetical protein